MSRWRLAVVVALALLAPACGIRRIDAPVTFKAEHRLNVLSPSPDADVRLPVTVTWEADTSGLEGPVRYALFVDRVPVGTDREVRLRICTEGEKQPPQPGSFHKPCTDDRKTVFFTRDTTFTFDCFVPRFSAPERVRNVHRVAIVLVDDQTSRIGQTVESVQFRVDKDDARRCRGI